MVRRFVDIARHRVDSLLRRSRLETELDRELRAHVDAMVEENIARGMAPDAARTAAMRDFGHVETLKEDSRDARRVAVVENLVRDLRHTLRGLLREPVLLISATVSIALGAAGIVAVFGLAKEVAFATPDVRDPARVVSMRVSRSSHVSYQRWRDLDASGAIEQIAGYDLAQQVNWFRGDATIPLFGPMYVTANFFDVLGFPIDRGRAFTAGEARAEDDPRVAVISHAFWQRELGGDSAVIGHPLILNGISYSIVGVLARNTRSIESLAIAPPVYLPLSRSLDPQVFSSTAQRVQLVGRIREDQSVDAARAAVDAADRSLSRANGDTLSGGLEAFGRIGTVGDMKSVRIRAFFGILAVVSLLIVLIACGNVAGLLMARGATRHQELAIRLAIGGSRSRVTQQLLVEAFWLATIGTCAGLGLSAIAMRLLNAVSLPIALPIELRLSIDIPVLLLAVALIVVTIVVSALAPSLFATRVPMMAALRGDEAWRVSRRFTARGLLLSGQVAVSTVLLVTAFLFLRNLQRSHVTNPGFDIDGIVVAEVGFARGRDTTRYQSALLERLAQRARGLPGARSASFATAAPLTIKSAASSGRSIHFDGNAEPQHVEYYWTDVGPDYFGTIGVRLLIGREFSAADRAGAPSVVIVNEEFARQYLGGRAVGRRFRYAGESDPTVYEIVGVVADSKMRTIGEERRGAIYFSMPQRPASRAIGFVFVRTASDNPADARSVQAALGAIDRSVAVEVKPMQAALTFALLPSRLGAAILGGLGLLGLLLAAFGHLALVSYLVAQRRREIAVRAALGATRVRIVKLVMRDTSILVCFGMAIGIGIAAMTTRALSAFLVEGLSTTDPVSFVVTPVVFIIATILASWIPVRRAMRVSPAVAMRLE